MADDETRKLHTEADDADVTVVLSTQELASRIEPDADARRHADGNRTVTATALLRIFGKKRNVDEEIEEAYRKGIALRPGEGEEDLTQLEDAEDPAADLTDRYRVVRVIAEGGQAKIALAVDRCLNRKVALKSMRQELLRNEAARHDFLTESRVTASLDHPAIVPIYSLNSDPEGGLHLAMKLMNGRTLKKYLAETVEKYEKEGVLNFDEAAALAYRLDIFLKICDALSYVHDRGVIHCDLKPENIMLGQYHETYVMDWGIARAIDAPAPVGHQTMGTPRYTSPENLLGRPCDVRSDIYTMGVILFELVTLSPAFPDTDLTRVIHKVRRGEFAPLRHRFGAPVRRDLAAIVRKATENDPDRRYQRIDELAADIRRFIRGEEVSANPDNIFGRFARWGFRHRRLMFVLTLVMIALGAVATSLSLYRQVRAGVLEKARSEFRSSRDHELGLLLDQAIGVSRTFDRQIANLEHDLSAVSTGALQLLSADVRPPADEPIYSSVELLQGHVPPTMTKAPGFGYEIDIENIVYHVAPGTKPANCEERVRRLAMLRPVFLRALIESRQESALAENNLPLLKQRIIDAGAPLIDAYLGFEDGLFVLYPCSKILSEDFDHRDRPWYKERMDGAHTTAAAMWGSPYLSVDGDLMLPCTLPMIDMQGTFHGVAAIDVSVLKLVKSLYNMGDSGQYLLEKTIVDPDGYVVVDIDEKFIKASNSNDGSFETNSQRPRYKDLPLFKEIKARRNGIIMRAENDRCMAYIFSGMYSVEWYYIEKIDLGKLLQERGVKVPDDTDPGA